MNIGVLALQGAFIEHRQRLSMLGIQSFEIRQLSDLSRQMDGLIIPGGESTVMAKLLHELSLFDPIRDKILDGMPVYGTCAGLILLAKQVSNHENRGLATMDITVRRNAYGRQLGSFYTVEQFADIGPVPMSFIRAPLIESAGEGVEILARVKGQMVAARQDNQLVTAFHPELSMDLSIHRYFADMIKASGK